MTMDIGQPFYCPVRYCDEGTMYRASPDEWLPEIGGIDPDAWAKPFNNLDLVEFDVMRKVGDFRLLIRRDGTFDWQGAAPPKGCSLFDSQQGEAWGEQAGEIAQHYAGNEMVEGAEVVIDIEAIWSESKSPIYRAVKETVSLGEGVWSDMEGGGRRFSHPHAVYRWTLEPVAHTDLGPLPTVELSMPTLDVAAPVGSA